MLCHDPPSNDPHGVHVTVHMVVHVLSAIAEIIRRRESYWQTVLLSLLFNSNIADLLLRVKGNAKFDATDVEWTADVN